LSAEPGTPNAFWTASSTPEDLDMALEEITLDHEMQNSITFDPEVLGAFFVIARRFRLKAIQVFRPSRERGHRP